MRRGTTGEARQHIEKSPEEVYDLVSDVTRMGEWSPECVGGEWLDGATGPTVGARFRGRNRHGRARWSTKPRVVVADRGRKFEFVVPSPLGRDNTRWTYRFEPRGTGTEVIESFEMLRDPPLVAPLLYRWGMGVDDRQADLEANLRRSLDALKVAAEGAQRSPS